MVPRIFLPWNPFPVPLKIFHQGSSPTVPGCSTNLRKVGKTQLTSTTTSLSTSTSTTTSTSSSTKTSTTPSTSPRLKKEKKTQTVEPVSHGVQTVLACSSQHISYYLLPIYAKLINVIHKAFAYIDLSGSHISKVELPYTSLSACLQVACRCGNYQALVTFGPD